MHPEFTEDGDALTTYRFVSIVLIHDIIVLMKFQDAWLLKHAAMVAANVSKPNSVSVVTLSLS